MKESAVKRPVKMGSEMTSETGTTGETTSETTSEKRAVKRPAKGSVVERAVKMSAITKQQVKHPCSFVVLASVGRYEYVSG